MNDPLLAAGSATCGTCSRPAYPDDAVWLDHRLILATLTPTCDHVPGLTLIVDPERLPTDRWCQAVAAGTGQRCRRRAEHGQRHCRSHRPEPATGGRDGTPGRTR